MNPADYLIIGLVVVSAVIGAFRGFLREVIAFLTWVVALWMAWHHSDLVAPYLGGTLAEEPYRTWAARALVALGVLLLGTLLGFVAAHFARVSIFSGLDRFLGLLFGVLRAVVVLGLLAMLAARLHIDQERWWKKSQLVPYAETVGAIVASLVGDDDFPARSSHRAGS